MTTRWIRRQPRARRTSSTKAIRAGASTAVTEIPAGSGKRKNSARMAPPVASAVGTPTNAAKRPMIGRRSIMPQAKKATTPAKMEMVPRR